jgi:RNA polymerase sigma factor (sigma-70 family)
MMTETTVFIVDDNADVRGGLTMQLEAAGLQTKAFARAEDFLNAIHPAVIGCLLLDVRMPEMTGPELQAEMARCGIQLPIIFLTGHGDIPLAVKCIQAGALDFLTKPVSGKLLLERIHAALTLSAEQWKKDAEKRVLDEKIASLTVREREVLELVKAGYTNKEIAKALGISVRTVEHHRSRILMRTGIENLFKLTRLAGTRP